MNARQLSGLTSAANNATAAAKAVQAGQQQMIAGANNLGNNRIPNARTNAKNATSLFGNAHRLSNETSRKLNNLANQAPGKLNTNIRVAANYAKKAAIEAAKANAARSLVYLGKTAEALGKVANTPM
jgi:hypothetical protein